MTSRNRFPLGALGFLCAAVLCPHVWGQDAQLAKKINEAIDKGVVNLKGHAEKETGRNRAGVQSLWGWALLETGVPASDKAMKILDFVRREVPNFEQTYDVSLAIIFLDRLGDPGDEPLIESLAVRLLGGQAAKDGGWAYSNPLPNREEKGRLVKLIQEMETQRSQGQIIKIKPRTPQEIQQDVVRQMKALEGGVGSNPASDNSNTQFGMIALWVARRHGLPVDNSLARVARRFQSSQVKTGHWGYYIEDPPVDDNHYAYPAMTCSGLIGLALGEGVKTNPKDLRQDPQVKLGLEVLAQTLVADPNTFTKKNNLIYFLFSLERTAVIYNLKKIGDQDWYLWGARKLVDMQAEDGSWGSGENGAGWETSFALLFLKRANVAKELTEILEAPLRKGPGNKKPDRKKLSDDLFDPPKVVPKKDAPKDKAPKQSRLPFQSEFAVGSVRWEYRDAVIDRSPRWGRGEIKE